MTTTRTRLIINPAAGAGRAMRRIARRHEALKAAWPGLDCVVSASPQDLAQRVRDAAERGDPQVLIAGGDGSAWAALNALAGTPTALGVLPVGTGNDLAASVGVPRELDAAIEVLRQGCVHAVDIGRVEGHAYGCVLGLGLDTPALETINRSIVRRSRPLYTWAALKALCTYTPRHVRVEGDDWCFEGRAVFVAVSNTRTYAGGMRLTPQAQVRDGLLDVCIVAADRLPRLMGRFGRIVRGRHAASSGVVLRQSARVVLTTETPTPVTLDGELTALKAPLEVRAEPGALRLLGGVYPQPSYRAAA